MPSTMHHDRISDLRRLYDAVVLAFCGVVCTVTALSNHPLSFCNLALGIAAVVPLLMRFLAPMGGLCVLILVVAAIPMGLVPCTRRPHYVYPISVLLCIYVSDCMLIIGTIVGDLHNRSSSRRRPRLPPQEEGQQEDPCDIELTLVHALTLRPAEEEQEECCVCLESTPFALRQCGHRLCPVCCRAIVGSRLSVLRLYRRPEDGQGHISCPICRAKYNLISVAPASPPSVDSSE